MKTHFKLTGVLLTSLQMTLNVEYYPIERVFTKKECAFYHDDELITSKDMTPSH